MYDKLYYKLRRKQIELSYYLDRLSLQLHYVDDVEYDNILELYNTSNNLWWMLQHCIDTLRVIYK